MPFSGRKNIISIVGFLLGLTLVLSVVIPWVYKWVILPDWAYVLIGLTIFILIGHRFGRFRDKEK